MEKLLKVSNLYYYNVQFYERKNFATKDSLEQNSGNFLLNLTTFPTSKGKCYWDIMPNMVMI